MPATPPLRILITGAGGNIGSKLTADLSQSSWCSNLVALDIRRPVDMAVAHPNVSYAAVDLTKPSTALDAVMADADAVVHLAARNPYPDASWDDGAVSFDMTLNALEALARGATRERPKRFVFASSNHVMGGYKDHEPRLAAGALTPQLPPLPGTRTGPGDVARAYAAAKLMGERLLGARAAVVEGLTAVSLRIGWCQPGANRPVTLSASGVPDGAEPEGADAARDLAWFRAMWLSDRDAVDVFSAALRADAAAWPAPAIVVNAMSDNAGMPWNLGATRRLIGYRPQDDAIGEIRAQTGETAPEWSA